MSYDIAIPKALKFLVSNGDLIDDEGNVIAHSDTLVDFYNQATPQVKKYLLSDGSVVDENGNLIIKNDYYKKMYDQAIPTVAKYLHLDGTIDENPGGGGGDVTVESLFVTENGTYTAPSGKAYSPVTVNVPSGKQLYIYHYEQGYDSLLCEASSFENITVGMKGVMSSASSEYMTGVTCTEKTDESATFSNDNYSITITSSDIPTSLSSILN